MPTENTAPRPCRFSVENVELALAEDHLEREYTDRPRAFLDALLAQMEEPLSFRLVGDVGVVDILGPLEQRGGWYWDGYDSIASRAAEAFADPRTHAVVLSIDSAGGAAAGNLAAARQLRALADSSNKPLVAHAGTLALSAAYALACAADRVMVTDDGAVGSVGVISRVFDRTKANEAAGLNVMVVRSGALKADPNPDVALTDASVARVQARIAELATAFAGWVGERRGQSVDQVLSLKGATVYATKAVEAGLADAIGSLDDAITTAASMAADNAKAKATMNEQQRMAAILGALREQMGVTSDAELTAAVATLKQQAVALPKAIEQLDDARARLAQREKADADRERAEVIQRHRQRGALTDAMVRDEAYMETLSSLTAKALDTNLSRLPVVAHTRVEPVIERAERGDTTTTSTLSDIERSAARAANLTDEEFLKQRAESAQKAKI